jgi:hypothetical protein
VARLQQLDDKVQKKKELLPVFHSDQNAGEESVHLLDVCSHLDGVDELQNLVVQNLVGDQSYFHDEADHPSDVVDVELLELQRDYFLGVELRGAQLQGVERPDVELPDVALPGVGQLIHRRSHLVKPIAADVELPELQRDYFLGAELQGAQLPGAELSPLESRRSIPSPAFLELSSTKMKFFLRFESLPINCRFQLKWIEERSFL